ncbi:MAG: phage major capsid protein [Phycisphaeraceae bacterium]|nr:phage major capsid protein [Phycisphaeraceae bacterium]
MPTPQKILNHADPVLSTVNHLRESLGAAIANANAGRGSLREFADLKHQALEVVNAVTAAGKDADDDDQRAADAALLIAQGAGGWMKSIPSGPKCGPNNPGSTMRGFIGKDPLAALERGGINIKDFISADAADLDDGGFASLGEFLRSVRDQRTGLRQDQRLYQATGQNTLNDSAGGFLVPTLFQRELIMSQADEQPWLNLLNRFMVPDGVGSVTTPMLSDRDTSGEDIGGVELQRVAETGTVSLSTLVFKSRKSNLHKAGTRVRVSNELLTDNAVGFESALQGVFARAVSLRQALDFVSGSGTGEPLGFLNANAAATYEQAKETSQVGDTIVYSNIVKMWTRLSPAVRSRAIWLAHPGVFQQLAYMTITVGTGGAPVMVMDVSAPAPQTLLGRPIYFTEACPLLGERGDINVFNPGSYTYTYKPLRIDLSRDFRFDTDETEFKIILRDDGGPTFDATRTDAQGFENSEFICLAERA